MAVNTDKIIDLLIALTPLAVNIATDINNVVAAAKQAKAEGRDLSDAELDAIVAKVEANKATYDQMVAQARAEIAAEQSGG